MSEERLAALNRSLSRCEVVLDGVQHEAGRGVVLLAWYKGPAGRIMAVAGAGHYIEGKFVVESYGFLPAVCTAVLGRRVEGAEAFCVTAVRVSDDRRTLTLQSIVPVEHRRHPYPGPEEDDRVSAWLRSLEHLATLVEGRVTVADELPSYYPSRKAREIVDADEHEDDDPISFRLRRRAARGSDSGTDDESEGPMGSRKRRRRNATDSEEDTENEEWDEDDQTPVSRKRRRRADSDSDRATDEEGADGQSIIIDTDEEEEIFISTVADVLSRVETERESARESKRRRNSATASSSGIHRQLVDVAIGSFEVEMERLRHIRLHHTDHHAGYEMIAMYHDDLLGILRGIQTEVELGTRSTLHMAHLIFSIEAVAAVTIMTHPTSSIQTTMRHSKCALMLMFVTANMEQPWPELISRLHSYLSRE